MHQINEISTQKTNLKSKEDFYNLIFNCSGIQEKKTLLKELSEIAKLKIDLHQTEESRINDVLVEMFSSSTHHTFNTFKGWKEQGMCVKKGQKGFFIWSNPLKGKKSNSTKENQQEKENSFTFFGLAHIFSNAQVEPLKN